MTRLRGERGSATIELVILAPLFGLLLAFVAVAGRVQAGRADVEGAARSAARTLSLARDPHAAVTGARIDAGTSLDVGGSTCRSMTFSSQISGERTTVSITCSVDLRAAAVLPVPGSYTVTGTATERIDQWRE